MGADKPNINTSHCEFYNDDQPVIVAPNIENIVLIACIVSGRKVDFYIRQIFPFGLQRNMIPTLKGNALILTSFCFIKILQSLMRHNPHPCLFDANVQNNFEIQNKIHK